MWILERLPIDERVHKTQPPVDEVFSHVDLFYYYFLMIRRGGACVIILLNNSNRMQAALNKDIYVRDRGRVSRGPLCIVCVHDFYVGKHLTYVVLVNMI